MDLLKQIIPLDQAIEKFREKFPNSQLTGLKLEYEGPFLTYSIRSIENMQSHSYKFSASTGSDISERTKEIRPKKAANMERKKLNIDNLLPLEEITAIALSKVPVDMPFEWELERKRERTIWEVEISDAQGGSIYEVKLDAQDGTVIEIEYKI